MSYFNGPKIITDGLVVCLDAANIKSFRGEPTTNIVQPTWSSWGIDGSGQGSVGTRTIYSDYYCRIVDSAANTRQSIWAYNASPSTTYTFSVKYRKIAGTPTLRFQIQPYAGATYQSSVFPTTAQLGIIDTDDWQTATYSVTGNASTDRFLWFMQDGDDYTTYTHTFELKEAQVEAKTYYTPFVSGSRGTTVETGGGLYDLTNGNNNGTLVNGPTYTSSFGGSIVFDGTNDKITTSANFTFGSTTQKSYTIWFKTASSTEQTLIFLGANLNDYKWQYIYIGSGGTLSVMFGDNSFYNIRKNGISGFNLITGNWVHLGVTVNIGNSAGNRVNIYVNGIRYPISSFDNDSGNPFYDGAMYLQLGASNLGGGSDFYAPLTGQISNVALYKIELTNQQILQNYNATKGRYGL